MTRDNHCLQNLRAQMYLVGLLVEHCMKTTGTPTGAENCRSKHHNARSSKDLEVESFYANSCK